MAVFRIGFGLMMFFSILRFAFKGWIEQLYIAPQFYFPYYGFEWIKPLGAYTYLLFVLCGLSAFLVAIGYKYRLAILVFFLSFSYIELMDKTNYLNHYYFISVLSFLMLFLPANAYFSVDAYQRKYHYPKIPRWTIDSIKLLLGMVYFYAGLAKINSDWLLKAMPLKIWLPSKYDLPLIGESLMHKEWFHYAMSWSGMLYDLAIPFLLLYRKTRWLAFILVLVFHIFTRVLFPIGMFPYIMIVSTLIFFDATLHEKILNGFRRFTRVFKNKTKALSYPLHTSVKQKISYGILVVFFAWQLLFPWRYLLYPGELFWTEEGYRFSWRVMLMEKAGYAQFKIVNPQTQESFYVDNTRFLTPRQEKQMSFQPDFILDYAHFLGDYYKAKGMPAVEVYVDCFVALNGRLSKRYIDPKLNLYPIKDTFKHKDWILPLDDEIKGL